MAKAFVLIETKVGKTIDVVNALKSVEGVLSADPVTGTYDVIAIVEGLDVNAVGNLITKGIHTINGVDKTVTCIAMELSR